MSEPQDPFIDDINPSFGVQSTGSTACSFKLTGVRGDLKGVVGSL